MVTTGNMSLEDPIEIIRALQQQMWKMQQCYEGELVALRVENAGSSAKKKANEEEDKTVHVE